MLFLSFSVRFNKVIFASKQNEVKLFFRFKRNRYTYTYIQDETYIGTPVQAFKPIHTHYTLRYASTGIYLYADTVSHCYIYLALKIHLVLHYLPFTVGLMLIHWYIYSSRYMHIIHKDTPVQAYIYMLIQLYVNTYI